MKPPGQVKARDELLLAAARARRARADLYTLPRDATDAQLDAARAAVRTWENAEGMAMAALQRARSRHVA